MVYVIQLIKNLLKFDSWYKDLSVDKIVLDVFEKKYIVTNC